jgi:CheY-like chemotaxis protein
MQIMEDIKEFPKGMALAAGKNRSRLEVAQQQMAAAGYETDFSESPQDAVKKMASIPYELILLDEDMIQEDKRVLIYMVGIPMQLRRSALYLVTGAKVKTMDTLSAFGAGLDGLINYQDIGRLAWYIQALEKEHDRLYREFAKILQ